MLKLCLCVIPAMLEFVVRVPERRLHPCYYTLERLFLHEKQRKKPIRVNLSHKDRKERRGRIFDPPQSQFYVQQNRKGGRKSYSGQGLNFPLKASCRRANTTCVCMCVGATCQEYSFVSIVCQRSSTDSPFLPRRHHRSSFCSSSQHSRPSLLFFPCPCVTKTALFVCTQPQPCSREPFHCSLCAPTLPPWISVERKRSLFRIGFTFVLGD